MVYQTEFGKKADEYLKLNPTASVEDAANAVRGGWSVPAPNQPKPASQPTYSLPTGFNPSVPVPPQTMTSSNSSSPMSPTPPMPQSAAVPTPPALGYGGGNYNDLGYNERVQMQDNEARIKNDPAFRQSEVDRTLGVIKSRQGAGEDISAQNDYLYRVLGYQPPTVPKPPSAVSTTPMPQQPGNMAYSVGTNADREAEARRRVEQAIAEKRRIADQQKQGLVTSFDRSRQLTNDTRTLENVQNARNLNPFSGRSDYAQGMIARERAITDRQQAEDLATRTANVDELLAGFENASETERARILDELTRMDREFGLQQGQLTGDYNGTRTLAGQQLDWNKDPNNPSNIGQSLQNQLAQLKLNNYPEEVRQAAQVFEQQLRSGQISNDTAAWKLQELQNPDSPTNQAAKLDLQLKQMELEYLPQEQRLKLQQLQKQIAQIGAAPYRSEEEKQLDQIKVKAAQEELNQLQAGPKKKDGIDAKTSSDNYNLLLGDLSEEGVTKALANQLLQANRDFLSDADYRRLSDYITENY